MGRRVTTGITLLILCGIVALGAMYGWNSLFAELPNGDETVTEEPDPCSSTQVKAGQRLRARQVRVSVFNAGTRGGLAQATLETLTGRGFKPGETGNAPDSVGVRNVQVRSSQKNDLQARLVAQQFGKKTKIVVSAEDLGPGVDVVVGNKFSGVRKGAKTFIKIKERTEVCVPVASQSPSAAAAAG